MSSILQSLKSTLSSFTALATHFHEPHRKAVRQGASFGADIPSERSSLTTTNTGHGSLLRHLGANAKLFDTQSLGSIMRKFRQVTGGLRQAVAFATLCSWRYGSQADFEDFQAKRAIQQTHLAPIVKQHYILQSPSIREAKPLQGVLEDASMEACDPSLIMKQFLGQGASHTEAVVVEYRYYNQEPRLETSKRRLRPQEIERQRYMENVQALMRKLASLLYELPSDLQSGSSATAVRSLGRPKCLPFLGYLEQPDDSRFAFLFKAPEATSLTGSNEISSLSSFIVLPLSSTRLSRTVPYKLCETVLNLHACGWVHKNIQSINILLVPQMSGLNNLPDHENLPGLTLYLKSFEIARPQ